MAWQALTRGANIEDILTSREKAIHSFRLSMTSMMDCSNAMKNSGYGKHVISQAVRGSSFYGPTEQNDIETVVATFISVMDKDIWKHIATVSGMINIMDATARKQWESDIETKAPECTYANIEATLNQLQDNQQLIFNRGVVKAFQKLSPKYKTNDAFKIGKKIVMQNAIGFYEHGCDALVDVERVMHVLDGKKPPVGNNTIATKLTQAGGCYWTPKRGDVETDYMTGKVFKNKNAHITFKRQDLVDRCNKIIAAFYSTSIPDDSHRTNH